MHTKHPRDDRAGLFRKSAPFAQTHIDGDTHDYRRTGMFPLTHTKQIGDEHRHRKAQLSPGCLVILTDTDLPINATNAACFPAILKMLFTQDFAC